MAQWKEYINVSKRTGRVLVGIWASVIVGAGTYFISRHLQKTRKMKMYRESKINSRIDALKSGNRGICLVRLTINDSLMEFYLPVVYEINQYKIQAGDSISKEAGSDSSFIFRMNEKAEIIRIGEWRVF